VTVSLFVKQLASLAGMVGSAMEVGVQTLSGTKQLSEHELGLLGIDNLAYVKRVVVDGDEAFAIHAADGTQIAVLANRDVAMAVVRQHDLEPSSVH
jgi:hypothetical protein